MIPYCARQRGEASLQGIKYGALRDGRGYVERDLAIDAGEGAEMQRKRDADQGRSSEGQMG